MWVGGGVVAASPGWDQQAHVRPAFRRPQPTIRGGRLQSDMLDVGNGAMKEKLDAIGQTRLFSRGEVVLDRPTPEPQLRPAGSRDSGYTTSDRPRRGSECRDLEG